MEELPRDVRLAPQATERRLSESSYQSLAMQSGETAKESSDDSAHGQHMCRGNWTSSSNSWRSVSTLIRMLDLLVSCTDGNPLCSRPMVPDGQAMHHILGRYSVRILLPALDGAAGTR